MTAVSVDCTRLVSFASLHEHEIIRSSDMTSLKVVNFAFSIDTRDFRLGSKELDGLWFSSTPVGCCDA